MARVNKAVIVRAAEEVVRDKSARKLSLDAVAAQCGLSKGGLIHHFGTKQSLLEPMLEAAIAREDASAEAFTAAGDGLLVARLSSIFELMKNDESLLRPLIAADPALLEPMKSKEAELRSKVFDAYSDPELAQLLILAAQGMFFGRVLGVVESEDPMFAQLRERLLILSADLT